MAKTTTQNDATYAQRITLWTTLVAKPLVVILDGLPPSVNAIWRHTGRRVYKTYEATSWDRLAQIKVRKAAQDAYGTHDLSAFSGKPLHLEINYLRSSWVVKSGKNKGNILRPDASNLIKVTEDAVTRALGLEDSAVTELVVMKQVTPGPDTTLIRLYFRTEF